MAELIEFIESLEPLYRAMHIYKPKFHEMASLAPDNYTVIRNPYFNYGYRGKVEGHIIYVYMFEEDIDLSVLIHELAHVFMHDNGPCSNSYWHRREIEANAVEHLVGCALHLKWDLTSQELADYDYSAYKHNINYKAIRETADYIIDFIVTNLTKIEHIETETFISNED